MYGMETPREPSTRRHAAPDREAAPILSSILKRFGPVTIVLVSVAAAAATLTTLQKEEAPPQTAAASTIATPSGPPARTDALWPAIDSWNRLRQSDRLPFNDYASFLIAHRGWPGENALRRAAERQIVPDQADPSRLVAFFDLLPPLSGAGRVRYAEALAATGQPAKARDAAAAAWTGGALSADDEARLLGRFAGQFTPTEQDQRMERLLWDHSTASATRQLALVTSARKPIYAARLALQTKADDAQIQAGAQAPGADRDAGYVIDRAAWLRDSNQWVAARAWLAQPRTFDAPPYDARLYLEALLAFAKAAASDSQNDTVYGITANAEGAFAPGTDIGQRPLNERDRLYQPRLAGRHDRAQEAQPPARCRRCSRATPAPRDSRQPSQGRLLGRPRRAGGRRHARRQWQYFGACGGEYGPILRPARDRTAGQHDRRPARSAPLADSRRSAHRLPGAPVVRAARLLGEQRQWQDQSLFMRQIANDAKTDVDHALAGELGAAIPGPIWA
jgi:soluble lytic murein transglycosylase